jgi:GST-like protein
MTITLLGHPLSNNTRKVQWALHELGVDHTFQTIDLMSGEQKSLAVTALNPNARVPILKDGDFVVSEAQAILIYLAEKTGRLLPADPRDRTRALQWLFWVTSDLQMQLQRPWYARLLASFGQPLDEVAHARDVAAAATPLGILDGALAGRRFLVGDAFSIADIAALEPIELCAIAGIPLAAYGHLARWREGLQTRTGFVATRPTS